MISFVDAFGMVGDYQSSTPSPLQAGVSAATTGSYDDRIIQAIVSRLEGLFASRQVTAETSASPLSVIQPALHRVAQLADLPADWDSYGADPPSNEAVARIYEFLFAVNEEFSSAFGASIQPYAVAPMDDGGLQIEWRGPTAEIEVEVDPEGGLAYLYIDKNGPERSFVEENDATWPDVMERIAQTLSSTRERQGIGTDSGR